MSIESLIMRAQKSSTNFGAVANSNQKIKGIKTFSYINNSYFQPDTNTDPTNPLQVDPNASFVDIFSNTQQRLFGE